MKLPREYEYLNTLEIPLIAITCDDQCHGEPAPCAFFGKHKKGGWALMRPLLRHTYDKSTIWSDELYRTPDGEPRYNIKCRDPTRHHERRIALVVRQIDTLHSFLDTQVNDGVSKMTLNRSAAKLRGKLQGGADETAI